MKWGSNIPDWDLNFSLVISTKIWDVYVKQRSHSVPGFNYSYRSVEHLCFHKQSLKKFRQMENMKPVFIFWNFHTSKDTSWWSSTVFIWGLKRHEFILCFQLEKMFLMAPFSLGSFFVTKFCCQNKMSCHRVRRERFYQVKNNGSADFRLLFSTLSF